MGRFPVVLSAIAWLALSGAPGPAAARQDAVLVFAAASLRTTLDALLEPARLAGVPFRASFAATSALARQIEERAPADLFISADVDWMNYLAERKLIRSGTRVNLLTNRLVLIAPRSEPRTLPIAPRFPLAAALEGGRLAVADPAVVPAGKYAKAALTSLGVWDSVAAQIAPADNVRAALLLVSRAEAPLGIVYRTDAAADDNVIVVDTFPETTHPPIVYPAAVTTRGRDVADRLLAFLQGAEARRVFEAHGFGMAIGAPAR
jgi:molybdate transport system substrate-binding protein